MNPLLVKAVDEKTPKIDPRIGFGLSYNESDNIPKYVDRLFRINSKRFPSKLKYLGFEPTSPMEGYRYMTRVSSNNVRKHDINRNDIRLYSFNFEYDGKAIRKYINLPFILRHGFMYINGVKYIVAPVMADGIITVKPTEIFIKLIKTKLWFKKINTVSFKVDGEFKYTSVYYSSIYNIVSGKKMNDYIKMKTTLIHYLCCKFGLTQTLKMFNIGEDDFVSLTKEDLNDPEINERYSCGEWVVVESNGKKPPHSYRYSNYTPSSLVFLVKRDVWNTNRSVKNIFGSLFYVLGHYTNLKRMNPRLIDNVRAWQSMLGEAIRSTSDHIHVIEDAVSKHMVSLDGYVDEITIDDFSRIGLGQIKSIYHLFVYIIENFSDLTNSLSHTIKSNSLYGKQLQVNQFLLFDLTKAINNAYFELSTLRLEEENNPKINIRVETIIKILNSIRTDTVMYIKNHTEIITMDDPTDLPLLKMGRVVIPQEKSDRAKTSNSRFSLEDQSNSLHESLLEVGATFDMTKSDPSGKSRLNPFVSISDDYTIVENPELRDKINEVRNLLY